MAIFHLSTKAISRKIGRTATVSAAYRSGEKIKCERTGLIHDYTRKKGVMTSSAFLFDGDKKIVLDRQDLWNTAEKSEKRKDARTAREIIVNLPHELSHNQRLALVDEFTKLVAKTYGVAIDYAIHEPNRKGDDRNFHAHIMMTTRQATLDNGVLVLGAKSNLELENKALKAKGLPSTQQQITDIRKDWADYANEHLKKAGLDIEIDHRSHKERGLAATPTIKLGVAATALERKGIRTEKGDINRIIQQSNLEIHELHNTELPAKTVKLPVTATTKDNVLQAVIGDYRNTEHFALDASLRAGFIEINLDTMQLVKETITKDYLVPKSKRREFIQNLQDHATAFLNINDEYIQAMQNAFGDYKLPSEFRDEIDNAFEYINKSKHIDLDAYYTVNKISDDVSISKEQKIQIQSTNNYEYQPW